MATKTEKELALAHRGMLCRCTNPNHKHQAYAASLEVVRLHYVFIRVRDRDDFMRSLNVTQPPRTNEECMRRHPLQAACETLGLIDLRFDHLDDAVSRLIMRPCEDTACTVKEDVDALRSLLAQLKEALLAVPAVL